MVPAFLFDFLILIKLQKLSSASGSFPQLKEVITTTKHKRDAGIYTYREIIQAPKKILIDLPHCFGTLFA